MTGRAKHVNRLPSTPSLGPAARHSFRPVTEPDSLRVFVNGTALSLPRGARILDAVRALDPAAARAVAAGERAVMDSRGLPVALDAPVAGGTVLRLVSGRSVREEKAEP
ncbi:MAG: hypothetical protein ACHQQR_06630 [Gemmatimonadales bacterium]